MGVEFRCEIKQHGSFKTEEERDRCPNHTCHRTWFKVLFNPFFRKLGFHIVSCWSDDHMKLFGYKLRRY